MNSLFSERRYLIPFRSGLLPQIFTDTLVIGSGVAGASAALAAAEHGDVVLICKQALDECNTYRAQGGMAAVTTEEDSLDLHIQDTLKSGAGLCDMEAVRHILSKAPDRVADLEKWGMRFDRDENNKPLLGLEGAHSRHRILHADGDGTGRELMRCLGGRLRSSERIRIFDNCFALDLITPQNNGDGPVMGAITHHPRYGLQMVWAKATILATGGSGQLFRETTNPNVATGDGLAMAYRAGARLADLALMQFHPTTLYVAGASRSLISEAVRGEGAYLVDRNGHRFMLDVDERGELAPRDIVSRAIWQHLAKTEDTHVFLDVRHLGPKLFKSRFPGISEVLEQFNIEPGVDLIPVQPAAHFMIGGVWVDRYGRSSLPGLYACGEAACTGLHGANRLASNSLIEGLVCGTISGQAAEEMRDAGNPWGVAARPAPVNIISDIPISEHGELDLSDVRQSVCSVMWRNVGIERSGAKLTDVLDMFDFWARYTLDKIFDDPSGWETQNMLLLGQRVTCSALWRCESRGVHTRVDYPEPREEYCVHDIWRMNSTEPETIAPST
ncbi:MAG TPA: L-aspartate oxidase [Phycisphaeraceae bacterium]|nr:L-aspartate oxidase [Phycisphaeraceae bacterium]